MQHIPDYQQFKKNITESKGQDLADKYVAKLRSEFKKLNDDELDEFKKTIAKSLDLNESINEAEFKHINKGEHKIKLAIKDVEKKSRLKVNRDKEPEYEQLSLNKIMLSKVLGRERLGKEHVAAWEKLKKEYELTESVNEAKNSFPFKGRVEDLESQIGNKYYIETTDDEDTYNVMDSKTKKFVGNFHYDGKTVTLLDMPNGIMESVVNEDSSPMSSLLQSFEKAMTNKKAYAKLASEMSAAPANEKQMIMQMANKNIPEAGANIQGMIDSFNDGSLTADMLGMPGGEGKAISQFKKALKVVDFAIKTIKQHANESVTEGQNNPVDKKFIRDWEKLCLAMIGRLKIDMRQAPVESRSLFTKNIKRIEDVLDIPTEISYFTE